MPSGPPQGRERRGRHRRSRARGAPRRGQAPLRSGTDAGSPRRRRAGALWLPHRRDAQQRALVVQMAIAGEGAPLENESMRALPDGIDVRRATGADQPDVIRFVLGGIASYQQWAPGWKPVPPSREQRERLSGLYDDDER